MTQTDLLAQRPLFEKFLARTNYQLSSFSFVNIFTWKDFFDFEFKVIDDTLCIFASHALGTFLYLPPLGANVTPKITTACFDIMFKKNKGRGISRIENIEEPSLSLFPPEEYIIFKKGEEFVYCREEIAELRGNKYKSKRSAYNQFARSANHTFVPYESKMHDACLALYSRWAEERKKANRDDIYQEMIEENYKVHDICLTHAKDLGLVGRAVFADGKLVAYTFGFPLKKDVFCVLLEIADLKTKGLPAYIFKEFCSDKEIQSFKFINVMDDFGLENIRATKLSFKPDQVHAAYVVSRKG
jgi:hypothetical protein